MKLINQLRSMKILTPKAPNVKIECGWTIFGG